ncbi:MAG: hypothetical protein IPM24_28410, partial [Bryobacterales bacterium]|nr:hypothetical protein [Bryobacterales bacterium]
MPRPRGTGASSGSTRPRGGWQSVENPESGTTSYTYKQQPGGAKTDAKGQQVQYSYDGHQRLVQVRRYAGGSERLCERVDFSYDTNPYDGGYTAHGWGRRTAARWGGTGCVGGITGYEMVFSVHAVRADDLSAGCG